MLSASVHGITKHTPSPRLQVLDSIVRDAIGNREVPGAVVLIWHDGQVVYRKAFGNRAVDPRGEPMTVDTIFDVASLTKVVATATAVMQLVQHGDIRLNDPVAKYIPEFSQNGKEDVTVRDLLTHFSGLREDLDITTPWQGKQTAFTMAYAEKPVSPPGSKFLYSDINFIVLAAIVEKTEHRRNPYSIGIFSPSKKYRARRYAIATRTLSCAPPALLETQDVVSIRAR